MNGVKKQKKTLNKSKKSVIKQKPFSLSMMKNKLKNTIKIDQKTASI